MKQNNRKRAREKTAQFEKVEFICGARILSLYQNRRMNMKVLIIGENHTDLVNSKASKTALEVDQYLRLLFHSQPSTQFDLFVETHWRTSWDTDVWSYPDSSLGKVDRTFENCLSFTKANCEFKNLRAHYVDVRSGKVADYNNEIVSPFYDNPPVVTSNENFWYTDKLVKALTRWRQFLKLGVIEELYSTKFDFSFEDDVYKLSKTLKKLSPKLRKIILTSARQQWKAWPVPKPAKILETIDFLLSDVRPAEEKSNMFNVTGGRFEAINSILGKAAEALFYRLVVIMDVYTLGRLFSPTLNVRFGILHTGSLHSEHYERILKSLKFTPLYVRKSDAPYIKL